MAYQIASTCDACHQCYTVCPVEGAVIPGDVYRIDADLCVDCNLCADDCPTSSIYKPRIAVAA